MDRFYAKQPVRFEEVNGKKYITGYASVFYDGTPDTEYEPFEGFKIRVAKTAFDKSLARGDDVRALFNHDDNYPLARLSAGDLRVKVDQFGLMYQIAYDPDDPDHVKVFRKIEKNRVTGSSFGGNIIKASRSKDKDTDVKTIDDFDLYDVSPVTNPAFTGSSVWSATNVEDLRKEYLRWVETEKRSAILEKIKK